MGSGGTTDVSSWNDLPANPGVQQAPGRVIPAEVASKAFMMRDVDVGGQLLPNNFHYYLSLPWPGVKFNKYNLLPGPQNGSST